MSATLITIITHTSPAGFSLWLRIGAAVIIAAALIVSCLPGDWIGDDR